MSIELTFTGALDELTGFDLIAISQHCGSRLYDMDEMLIPWAVMWAYENRGDTKRSWADIKAMRKRDVDAYFAAPNTQDPDELGKDETTIGGSPSGA